MESNNNLKQPSLFKNAFFLYFRLGLVLCVNLYTSRIILNQLGINDFGVYSVVGGIAVIFGFLNSAMTSSTQRFLSYEIGKGTSGKLREVFNATVNIHLVLAVIIFILCETLGLWYLKYKANLSGLTYENVFWLFQFSILTTLIAVIQVPYNALIVSMERMDAFAIFSLVEVIGKLVVAYSLVYFHDDKLTVYGISLFILSIIIAICFRIYCKINFKESKYLFYFNKNFYTTLLSYSGWNLFGNIASVSKNHGVNLVLNLFYGATFNASYAISMQVNGAVSLFMNNIQTAVGPRIVKSYAAKNFDYLNSLVINFSKYSFFLMGLIILPFYFNLDYILEKWLGIVPEYATQFVKFTLIGVLIESFSGPLMSAVQATGKVKNYQILIGTIIFLNLPISYFFLKYFSNSTPEVVVLISIGINIIVLFLRLLFVRKLLNLQLIHYVKIVLLPSLIIVLLTLLIYNFLPIWPNNFLINALCLELIFCSLIIIFGLNQSERNIMLKIFRKIKK